jgi:Kef-type K+ transport system membrane component KefB
VSSAPHLALAVAVICGCALAGGAVSARLGQPRVIGEIAAGVLLGPTLFGALLPGAFDSLFSADVADRLDDLARLGVILFVFFVGVEFASALARIRWQLIGSLALVSFAIPLLLGIALAFPLFSRLGGDAAPRSAFVLFFGVAFSITAIPVLAAILEDVGLLSHPLGRLALGTAAVTDVAAWCFLALAAARAGVGDASAAGERLLETVALAVAVLAIARPLLRRCFRALPARVVGFAYPVVGVGLAVGLATVTDHIGVNVLPGAFLAGLAVGTPPGASTRAVEQVRALNRLLLLPIFFVATGLLIDLGSPGSANLILAGALVLVVGTIGKVGPVSLVARKGGFSWRDSFGLGVLLNTKGLTEIVVLRIGYDLGLITRDALGVLIVVALVTTAAAVPALRRLRIVPLRLPDAGARR